MTFSDNHFSVSRRRRSFGPSFRQCWLPLVEPDSPWVAMRCSVPCAARKATEPRQPRCATSYCAKKLMDVLSTVQKMNVDIPLRTEKL